MKRELLQIMTITNRIALGTVGVDIGCGMEVVYVKPKRLELQQLDKAVKSKIPSGMNVRTAPHRFAEMAELNKLKCTRHIRTDKALLSIGTLGSGNHFIELDKSEIFTAVAASVIVYSPVLMSAYAFLLLGNFCMLWGRFFIIIKKSSKSTFAQIA